MRKTIVYAGLSVLSKESEVEMEKEVEIAMLLDFYGGLLTKSQADVLDLYYNGDLSLSEIADDLQISRQGVRDFLVRGRKHLQQYEERLGLVSRFFNTVDTQRCIIAELDKLRAYNTKHYKNPHIAQHIDNIHEFLKKPNF